MFLHSNNYKGQISSYKWNCWESEARISAHSVIEILPSVYCAYRTGEDPLLSFNRLWVGWGHKSNRQATSVTKINPWQSWLKFSEITPLFFIIFIMVIPIRNLITSVQKWRRLTELKRLGNSNGLLLPGFTQQKNQDSFCKLWFGCTGRR